jgi:glutathione peroxidase
MKPLLFTGLFIVLAAVVFVGFAVSRVMGKDVVEEPAITKSQAAPTAHHLQLRWVLDDHDAQNSGERLQVFGQPNKSLVVDPQIILNENDIASVAPVDTPKGDHGLRLEFTNEGSRRMADATSKHLKEQLAFVLDGEILTAPVVLSTIKTSAEIQGGMPGWTSKQRDDIVRNIESAILHGTTQASAVGPLHFTVKDIDGHDYNLSQLKGKVVMFVNVASKCGFTPQYKGLEETYLKYKDHGFVIVGFPANNFGHQEPGSNSQIKQFCTSKYDVTFPMMSKISVKGDDQHPLYKYLTDPATDGDFAGPISWNFNKFLIDRTGHVYARFASKTKPTDSIVSDAIEKGLGQPGTR